MALYEARIVLQGATTKDVVRRTFKLGNVLDEATALVRWNAIKDELVDVTLANIKSEKLHLILSEDNQLPVAGDCYEEAVISVHLNAPAEAEKLAIIRIPAPESVFLADGETVDVTAANLVAYIAAIAANSEISDGEQINVLSGNSGMKEGYKVSRAKRFS